MHSSPWDLDDIRRTQLLWEQTCTSMSCLNVVRDAWKQKSTSWSLNSFMPLFCSLIKDAAVSIRYTTGSCLKKREPSVTHNFVYSFVNGAMEKPAVSDPWTCLRNTKTPACWFMFPTIYLQGILWSMIEAIALESGVQLDWGKATMMYSLLSSQNVLNHSSWKKENDRSEKPANLSGCQYHN